MALDFKLERHGPNRKSMYINFGAILDLAIIVVDTIVVFVIYLALGDSTQTRKTCQMAAHPLME